jgi:predicted N-formylglutamate amidohydrolase
LTGHEKPNQLLGLAGPQVISPGSARAQKLSLPAIGGDLGTHGIPRHTADLLEPVRIVNAEGRGPFVLVVDHASNRIPPAWSDLGLPASERIRHIAWDPGALAVSMRLSELLDAPMIHSTVSRLVIDCNRDLDAPDLVPKISELTEIPGNARLIDLPARIAAAHAPFHGAIDGVIDARNAAGLGTILACMHSFTPSYKGQRRPWPIGLIHARDQRYTAALRDALAADGPDVNIGWNEPYSALNGVTYTLEHHGDGRGIEATMIEIRNSEILEPNGVALWAARLARCLEAARLTRAESPVVLGATTGQHQGAKANG